MSHDRDVNLSDEGYEMIKVSEVALPVTIWKTTMEIEYQRELKLAEETILSLVKLGVKSIGNLRAMMGVEEDVIVESTIVNLLKTRKLTHIDGLEITNLGEQALSTQRATETMMLETELRHDTYTDTCAWKFDGHEEKDKRWVYHNQHVLPAPPALSAEELERRHRKVQTLLDDFGLPGKSMETPQGPYRIMRVTPHSDYQAWRLATIELWYHADEERWDWRVMLLGGEERSLSEALKKMKLEPNEYLPLEHRSARDVQMSPMKEPLKELVPRSSAMAKIIQTEDHRQALFDAISDARRELIIVSPWLRAAAVDDELIARFDKALKRNQHLRLYIGYGIGGKGLTPQDLNHRSESSALERLTSLGKRYQGRVILKNISNTHQKLVITDSDRAMITSFNWLSFKLDPRFGVRRETGVMIENREEIMALRETLKSALGLD